MATTIPTGFPTADNTGVPSGTTLTAYTGPMTITTDGTVIENKIINGGLDITGANVTIRNCIITYNDFFGDRRQGRQCHSRELHHHWSRLQRRQPGRHQLRCRRRHVRG